MSCPSFDQQCERPFPISSMNLISSQIDSRLLYFLHCGICLQYKFHNCKVFIEDQCLYLGMTVPQKSQKFEFL